MSTEKNSVQDGKLTDEQLGKLDRKVGEIKRRVNEGTISYQDAIDVIQGIIIENKSYLHLEVLKGTYEIKAIEHIVDCNATPVLPFSGAEIELHTLGGIVKIEKKGDGLYVDGKKVVLHLSKKQQNGKTIKGHDLREELTGKKVLNACMLDYLLANPHFIPENWKKDEKGNTRYIFFWGTIFRSSNGSLHVRFLFFLDGNWQSLYYWLVNVWGGARPVALLAS